MKAVVRSGYYSQLLYIPTYLKLYTPNIHDSQQPNLLYDEVTIVQNGATANDISDLINQVP
jgi:hypothetical protein